MRKIVLMVFAILIANRMAGSDTLYYSVMKNSIDLSHEAYKLENFVQLANCCERILLVYKNDWLPYYYEAYALINMSFIETMEASKSKYCDRAQEILYEALKIKPGESELFVLQAMLYYARMAISPMLNGPLYLPRAVRVLNDAESLDPENPRIFYLRAKSTMNTPKFLGGGFEAALPIFEKALARYNSFKTKSYIDPDWGREDALRLYDECKKALAGQNSEKQPDK